MDEADAEVSVDLGGRPFLVFAVGDLPGLGDAMRYGGTEARLEGASPDVLSDRALLGSDLWIDVALTTRCPQCPCRTY